MIYRATKESAISNTIVLELNAAVLTATFPTKEGEVLADLYKVMGNTDKIVAHKTCPPVNGVFVATITITFN
jgi:hypothetical protein